MNTYICSNGDKWEKHITAETASKARYQYYKELEDDEPYSEWFRYIKVKLYHKFKVSDLFGDVKEFDRMKKARFIEFAKIGMKIEANGKKGVICGSNSSFNLDICLDGDYHTINYHPHWEMKYFDDEGKLIKEFTNGYGKVI